MAVYAVVPVKNLNLSKRRLSTVFTSQERRQLTLAMLGDVLAALKASAAVSGTVVVGEDADVQQIAEKLGADYLAASKTGLNPAIEEASAYCAQKYSGAVLVLPADIPRVTSRDINRIVELAKDGPAVVLASSSNGGTNALYRSGADLIPACFGSKSFLRHIKKAYQKGVSTRLYFSPSIAMDIDSVRDLKKMFADGNGTQCKQALDKILVGNQKAKRYLKIKQTTSES
jgi:2-phospho-L-lactate guanylyltransferase